MATKKAAKKQKAKLDIGSDPPVVVGGGGSSFIWIKKDLEPQLTDPANIPASAPQPHTPDRYYCFKVNGNISNVTIDDGSSTGPGHGVNNRKFNVRFD